MTPGSGGNGRRVFKAARFWNSNVVGACVGGALGGALIVVVMGVVVLENPTRGAILFAGVVVLALTLTVLWLVPGNGIAVYPYAVAVDQGRGLELHAVLRRVYIPASDLRDLRRSYLQPGYIVRLTRRHGLLGSFIIPWYFGDQAEPLAAAIREEIGRRTTPAPDL